MTKIIAHRAYFGNYIPWIKRFPYMLGDVESIRSHQILAAFFDETDFDVELDVRYEQRDDDMPQSGRITGPYMGHDYSETLLLPLWITSPRFWLHCKDHQVIAYLSGNPEATNWFVHDKDIMAPILGNPEQLWWYHNKHGYLPAEFPVEKIVAMIGATKPWELRKDNVDVLARCAGICVDDPFVWSEWFK